MPKGRPKKPAAVHKLEGTYQPCRHSLDAAPVIGDSKPTMPSSLTRGARKYWRWYADKLHKAGLLQEGDRDALASLCEIEAAEKAALADVEENGRYIWQVMGNGAQKRAINPAAKEALEMQREKRQYYALFGITPSIREKLHIKKDDEPESELLKFLGQNAK